jgi:hypothetical protein
METEIYKTTLKKFTKTIKSKKPKKNKTKSKLIISIEENPTQLVDTKTPNIEVFKSLTLGQKEVFEQFLSEREASCKQFIEMKTTQTPKLPNINEHLTSRANANIRSSQENRKKSSANLLLKKKNKLVLRGSQEKREKTDRLLSKESHAKNIDFLRKLTERVELTKSSVVSSSIDKERNYAEKNKLAKVHYSKAEKKDSKENNKITYFYSIMPGNNSQLIRYSMMLRENWKEDNNVYNFRWQQSSSGIDWSAMNKIGNIKQVYSYIIKDS